MPHPVLVIDRTLGTNGHAHTEKVRNPVLHHSRQRRKRRAAAIQADREIVTLVTRPVGGAILDVEHVEVDGARTRTALREQFAKRAKPATLGEKLDGRLVSGHYGTV